MLTEFSYKTHLSGFCPTNGISLHYLKNILQLEILSSSQK
jgi:hypothetical protein